ncbi:MAG: YidC/Oxa1 family membrane protein insertase [Solirubrobacteraceae bacterium]|nr:YidC/Oxa1 family membrane protein insertase [Solirubrobacteraceae bacterium]
MPVAVIAPLQWLIEIFLPILEFIEGVVGNWGVSIILLTILLRLAVLPLGVKAFKGMRGMQVIAPQLKALQAKYKDDRPRLQQETMKLYAEHKVNPFASCLPILVQIPFLIAFFYMLRTDLRDEICGQTAQPCGLIDGGGHGEGFLGIDDITAYPEVGLLILLLVIYIVSQMASSLVNMPPTADKNQKRLMMGLPLVFAFFLIPIKPPSGLFLYWITTNVFTLVQQWGLIKVYGHAKPLEVPEDDEPVRKGGSSGSAPPPPPRKRKKKKSGRRR